MLSLLRAVNHFTAVFFDALEPIILLLIRCYLASIFFTAGMGSIVKLDWPYALNSWFSDGVEWRWDTTLLLFQRQYQLDESTLVVVATIYTASIIVCSVFLVLGLLSRFSALSLLVINVIGLLSMTTLNLVHVFSEGPLFAGAPGATLHQHTIWAIASSIIIFWGGGRLSLDTILHRRYTALKY